MMCCRITGENEDEDVDKLAIILPHTHHVILAALLSGASWGRSVDVRGKSGGDSNRMDRGKWRR